MISWSGNKGERQGAPTRFSDRCERSEAKIETGLYVWETGEQAVIVTKTKGAPERR